MSPQFTSLVEKLKEIFQMDKPELDFGIYRILNARREQIQNFLDNRLAAKVQTALAGNAAAENEVYSHLLTFFSRYYDKGDFISLRRYKGDTYAIPYSGEEVKLHWANADQYYIKSGENFTHYDFSLPDGAKVHFRLVSADLTKDNIKDNDAVRCFVLWDPEEAVDEEPGAYPDSALQELNGELYVYFQYRRFKKGTKQKDKSNEATLAVLSALSANMSLYQRYAQLDSSAPTETDKNRKLFRKYLDAYTAKNTSDYFIHKDLKGFLTRELDFYIKNEIMHLDDIQNASSFSQIEKNLRTIQAVRAIALDLIDFMAQIENFQKKLWLKKKFVVQCDYCLTMDLVPKELHAEVLANPRQQEEWRKLNTTEGSLISDARMVDTKFFDESFKSRLLASIDHLDERCGGVLIHSENYGALRLIRDKYKKLVKCIYIDPPYNAQSSEILYKNDYKHSSWLSFMEGRIAETKSWFQDDTVQIIAIDEVEDKRLGLLLIDLFPKYNNDCISIVHNPTGQQGNGFSYIHEFAYFTFNSETTILGEENRDEPNRELTPDIRPLRNVSSGRNHYRESAATCFYPIEIKDGNIVGFGNVCPDDFHPRSINIKRRDGIIEVYPIDPSGRESKWTFGRDSVEAIQSQLSAKYDEKKGIWDIIRRKSIFRYRSLWPDKRYSANSYGSAILNHIIPNNTFTYPKSIYNVKDCISIGCGSQKRALILDYFAGSGTTAHAVINLNREDGGERKYILTEMGDHFETVLMPRIKKIVYSPEWRDGKPVTADKGISHCFKYMSLESYEDTLNNIELQDTRITSFDAIMQEEYLLKYMLDLESRGSIINTDSFRKPFDYKLKIALSSGDACEPRKVDLVETFNYLLGLRVESMEYHIDKGYVMVEGRLRNGASALIVWRDCDTIDSAALNNLLSKKGIRPGDSEFDYIYVNGDHSIANRKPGSEDDSQELKVRAIEEAFLTKMFEGE
ncbi:MAG: DNA methyltransferase [Akkermansia sp.]